MKLPWEEWEAALDGYQREAPADPRGYPAAAYEQNHGPGGEDHPFPWVGPPANVNLPNYPMDQMPLYGARSTFGAGVQADAAELVRIMLGAPASFRISLRTTVVAAGAFDIHWGAGNGSDIWTRANTTTVPENVELAAQWMRVIWRPATPVVAHEVVACGAILNG